MVGLPWMLSLDGGKKEEIETGERDKGLQFIYIFVNMFFFCAFRFFIKILNTIIINYVLFIIEIIYLNCDHYAFSTV